MSGGSRLILGISAYYHDSAAALLRDGEIVAAAQEERFSRKKHDAGFPRAAIASCLAEAGIRIEEVDQVAYYEQPRLKFRRIWETWLATAPRGLAGFRRALPLWLRERLPMRRQLLRELGHEPRGGFHFPSHHESHAASAFYPSPYEEATILTLDGVGEWATSCIGLGRGREIRLLYEQRFPHSLGLLYAAFTAYAGFRVNSGEYKLMGLASYGEPVYAGWIRERIVDLKEDGSFRLDLDYFAFLESDRMTSARFEAELGFAPRAPESAIRKVDQDLAASIQLVTEEIILRMARHARTLTGQRHLVLSGGVALNCVANGRLLAETEHEAIWVQPAADDAGGALGAALHAWHMGSKRPRRARVGDAQAGSLLGPSSTPDEARSALEEFELRFEQFTDEGLLVQTIAKELAAGAVVGHLAGRMEFGPRALGARSILADPRPPEMKERLNRIVKQREGFRPFAPCVLEERARDYFDLPTGQASPYMSFVLPVKAEFVADRSLPAITHTDGSARVQTVAATRSPRLHAILQAFEEETGLPMLVNTSFNRRGEPIVCSIRDALVCFEGTEIDLLVIENCLVRRGEVDLGALGARLGARVELEPD